MIDLWRAFKGPKTCPWCEDFVAHALAAVYPEGTFYRWIDDRAPKWLARFITFHLDKWIPIWKIGIWIHKSHQGTRYKTFIVE